MSKDTATSSPREFDLIVFGATGLTGRLVVEKLAEVDAHTNDPGLGRRWAVAGRDQQRVASVLDKLSLDDVEIVVADLEEASSLEALARRATVVLNLAGPYTPRGQNLIAACVEAGTSYVDLSGEIPLLRRVIDRFDQPARSAGVQIVQMAGWEAMPADLVTLIACHRAVGGEPGTDGPGASDPISDVTVTIDFRRLPRGGVPFNQAVSAGTLSSIVEMLEEPQAHLVGRPEALLTGDASQARFGPLRLGASNFAGRVLEPVVPVPFLNPPIIHRTAALLAAERGAPYRSASYVEGVDCGSSSGFAGSARMLQAEMKAQLQRMLLGITRLPLPLRRGLTALIRKVLPEAGTGPSGNYLHDWEWVVEAHATSRDGGRGRATLEGVGHPGYTATAAFIVEVALAMADPDRRTQRAGCITPALALGASVSGLRVSSHRLAASRF